MSDQQIQMTEEPRADAAEQSVLGICLLSEKAAGEVTRILNPEDFYTPAHQAIFNAIERLANERQPTDAVSVWEQIQADGTDRAIQEGPAYLHTLYSQAPPAVALPHHIELVKEAGARRAVALLGTLTQSMAATKTSGTANEILETIRERLDRITADVVDSDIPTLGDGLEEALAEIERVGTDGATVGIPTGFPELDNKLHGLRPGQMIMIAGRPAMGKALALNTPIPTPLGFTDIKDLKVGDTVLRANGETTVIIAATDVMTDHACYTVEFSDGAVITADTDHLWTVNLTGHDNNEHTKATLTTHQLVDALQKYRNTYGRVLIYGGYKGRETRVIHHVTPTPSVPVRCIQVDAPDHLYLAGPTGIPTHNSTIMLDFIRNAAFLHGKSVLVFSLEMSRMEMIIRTLSAQARIELSNLQTGKLTEDEWERLAKAHQKINNALIGIDDSPGTTVQDIRAKARRWQNRYGLDMIAVDYLQLMNSHRRVESRQQEVSEISRNMKLLAKEFHVPVLALSQLNRGAEQRTDKRPQLSDLRESGSLEQDSDVVILVHRDEVYNPELRVGEADLIIAKQRAGPTGIVPLVAQLHYSRFVPAAYQAPQEQSPFN